MYSLLALFACIYLTIADVAVLEKPADGPPETLVRPEGELDHSGVRKTIWYSDDLHYVPGKRFEHNTEILNKKQIKSLAADQTVEEKPVEVKTIPAQYQEVVVPATQYVKAPEYVLPQVSQVHYVDEAPIRELVAPQVREVIAAPQVVAPQVQYVRVVPTSDYYRNVVAPYIAARRV